MKHFDEAIRAPSVTIVIPFRGHLTLLQKLLNSIAEARNRIPMTLCEVIIVWDGPDDPTSLVTDFSRRSGLKVRCLFVEARQAMKRNIGMAAAHADVALCIDADCTIHPDLLKLVIDAFASPNVHMFAVPVMFEPPIGLLESVIAVMPYRQAFAWASNGERLWWAPGATIALRLSTVERLGSFWSIGRGSDRGEDVDLGLRWTNRLGSPAVATSPYCPSLHARETWHGLFNSCERAWRFGTSEGYLWLRHPAFRMRRIPPILSMALLSLLFAAVLGVLGAFTWGPLVTGALLLCIWIITEVILFRQSGIRLVALPAGFLLAFLFETGRTFSLWRAGTWTGGLWFHHRQSAGEWRLLALNGWLLLCIGFLLWMFFLLTTGR